MTGDVLAAVILGVTYLLVIGAVAIWSRPALPQLVPLLAAGAGFIIAIITLRSR